MKDKFPLVTVVIPVHNSGPYLSSCLDSIIEQTYKNIEIILADDDSKDDSKQIIDSYVEKNDTIKYIRVSNHNAARTRRDGISESSGEYICFIDSDDIVSKDYVEVLYSTISNTGLDIATGKLSIMSDNPVAKRNSKSKPRITIECDTLAYFCNNYRLSDEGTFVAQTMCAKIFRKKALQNIDYSVIKTSVLEDNYVMTQVLHGLSPQKIAMVESVIYFYRQHEGSTMSEVLTRTIKYGEKYITYPELFDSTANYIKDLYCDHSKLEEYINKLKSEEYYSVAEALTSRVYSLTESSKNLAESNRHLSKEGDRLAELVEEKSKLINDLINSNTFKAGRTVTAPLRGIRSMFGKVDRG